MSFVKDDFLDYSTHNLKNYSNVLSLLHYRAQCKPDKQAYIFLQNGETESGSLTYGELDRQARSIAAHLQSWQGERALLLYPSGLEFITAFFGCLSAGVVAVPVYPPRRNQKLSRLLSIANDAQASLALTTTSILADIEQRWEQKPEVLADLKWVATDTIETNSQKFVPRTVTPESLAFLQYTSGSTGTPKGVMVMHGNIIHNLQLIHQAFEHSEQSIGVGWLPLFHDLGLIGHILQPIYSGFTSILMPPIAFLQKPIRWLQLISKYSAITSGGPNFAYDLCVKEIKPEELTNLDLSKWELAYCGAEPIRAKTLKQFSQKFAACGFNYSAFYPCYGMAETTLFTTGGDKNHLPVIKGVKTRELKQKSVVENDILSPESQVLVGCGHPYMDTKVIIVNPDSLTLAEKGKVGEIWIAGGSIASGYWNRPKATEETFQAYLADTREGPFVRTGDLGFKLDGELFVIGRIKDVIIIRGRNYYPQDIEFTVENSHLALRSHYCAAFSVEIEEEEHLVVACEVNRSYLRELNTNEIIREIQIAVSTEHELEVFGVILLKPGSLPKTSSGKIQRSACKQGFLEDSLNVVGQWQKICEKNSTPIIFQDDFSQSHFETVTEMETWLVYKIGELLRIAPEKIDLKQPLAVYGLNSVQAVSIAAKLEEWLGISVSPTILYDYPSIQALADYLGQTTPLPESSVFVSNPQTATETVASITNKEIPVEYYTFKLFPEYSDLKKKLSDLFEANGESNPYFKAHQGVNNDKTLIDGRELINFCSFNYISMSGDPIVTQAVQEATQRYGSSVSASRVICGEIPLHRELEQEIADLLRTEDSIVYVGGHSTNVTTIGHLFKQGDLIIYDSLIHNSAYQGTLLSSATSLVFPHNNCQALDRILQEERHKYKKVVILIEGVYSMDGDIPNLPKFIEIKKRHCALLMIDEAHSIGTIGKTGKGIGEYFEINRTDIDIWMGTLSKSLASSGGYIAGCQELIEYLKYTAPGFVYSTGISPPDTASALASIRLLKAEPERVTRLHQKAKLFLELARAEGLNTGESKDTPIIPIIVNQSLLCLQLSQALINDGINVMPMVYPAVPENAARLRFFLNCNHTEKQIRFTVKTVAEELSKILASQTDIYKDTFFKSCRTNVNK